ncbi:hypothetical protein [Microbacterium rhizophilus]|uniref:hypothetical protein n=1 Tax=Microbacterium rhizophilus TaxID=3138934 RepID=UPI0031F1B149
MDSLKIFRRVAIWVIVVSLSIAALTGIYVILTGDIGELAGRVMATTSAVGAFGILVLCDLAPLGKPFQWVGLVGMPVAAVAFVLWLVQIWAPERFWVFDPLWRWLWAATLFAFALAHASLIVQLILRPQPVVRWIVGATLATIGAYAVMGAITSLVPGFQPGDWYWRTLSVVVILCVLGTIVSPVVGAILGPRAADTVRVAVDLPHDLVARIDAAGPREETIAAALQRAFSPAAADSESPAR